MHTRFLFAALLFLCAPVLAQLNFGGDVAQPDARYLESKQYKRIYDQGAKRNAAGHESMDWARWEAWLKVNNQTAARATASQPEPWQNHGPDTVSGRIISIAFHPSDSNTFLVGAASGGLWRTNDYGKNWACLTDAIPTIGVGAVAYNPMNPNSILIATGEGYGFGGEFTSGFGVFVSHDNGVSWNLTNLQANLSESFAGMDIIWNSLDTSKVAVGTSFGVYFSSDGGQNYSYTLDRLPARMLADPQNPNRIYLTARYYTDDFPGGLYISDDSGENWSLVPSGAVSGLPLGNEFGYSSIAVHPIYNHIVYLAIAQSSAVGSGPMEGLYKSSDYGLTFSEIPSTEDIFCYHPPYQDICQGWFANTIQVSLADTNLVFAGGTRLRKSFDGGINWIFVDLNLSVSAYAVHPDHHQTLYHPLTGDLFDCNDGGVNYSRDNGNSWTSISDGLVTHQFYSIAFAQTDPDVVVGGTQDVGTFSTTDAHGGSWDNDFSGDAFGHAIDPTDASTWYGTSFLNLGRIKSANSGMSWFQINGGTSGADQWRMPIKVSHWSNTELLSSNYDFIYKSENSGTTWVAVSSLGTVGGFAYDKMDADLVYAYELWSGNVLRSLDGGDSWAQLAASPGFPITDMTADPVMEGVVYATIGTFAPSEQVYVSINKGMSWTAIAANLPEVPANSIAVDSYDNEKLYVGTDLGVWVSENSGLSWSEYNDGLPAVVVEDLHFYAPDTSIRIGTYGRGYWRTKALPAPPPSGVPGNSIAVPDLTVFPNPATDHVKVQFSIAVPTVARLELHDANGNLLIEHNVQLVSGDNVIQLQTADLAVGVYLLSLNSSGFSIEQKISVVR